MLESEHERSQQGWLNSDEKEDEKGVPRVTGQSIWDYIRHHNEKSTTFHNFKYHPSFHKVFSFTPPFAPSEFHSTYFI